MTSWSTNEVMLLLMGLMFLVAFGTLVWKFPANFLTKQGREDDRRMRTHTA